MFFVYILQCADDTLYIGKTLDLEKRILAHNGKGKAGAKYTRSRRPVILKYHEHFLTHKEAAQREAELKKLTRKQKDQLVSSSTNYKL